MALYKYSDVLTRNDHPAFDTTHGPGKTVPYSGIYRCTGCGKEIAANADDPFPPQNHHQHPQAQSAILWKLIVATQ